ILLLLLPALLRLLLLLLLLLVLLALLILLLLVLLLLLLILLLLLLLLLELLSQGGDLPLYQLVIELSVDVVGRRAQGAPIGNQGLGPEPERLLRVRGLERLTLAELRVADVVGEARGARRIRVAAGSLSERCQRIVELARLVLRVTEVEVRPRRVGIVAQRLVVLLDGLGILARLVQPVAVTRACVWIEPADRQQREHHGGRRATPSPPGAPRRRRLGA